MTQKKKENYCLICPDRKRCDKTSMRCLELIREILHDTVKEVKEGN